MAVVLVLTTSGARAVDEELAKELKSVLLQQRQLERSAREYRISLESLRADEPATTGEKNALTALQNQLNRAETRLVELARRRQELEAELGLDDEPEESAGSGAVSRADPVGESAKDPALTPRQQAAPQEVARQQADPPQNAPAEPARQPPDGEAFEATAATAEDRTDAAQATRGGAGEATAESPPTAGTETRPAPLPESRGTADPPSTSPIESEVSRLTELLSGYYDSAGGKAAGPRQQDAEEDEEDEAPAVEPGKVQLNGAEGLIALEMIAERLERGPQSLRREVDIIYRVVVRRDGKLLRSSSHSLKSLGKSQYIGKVTVPTGDATITVLRNDWFVRLEGDDAVEYLITLDMPDYGDASLHLIPVAELKAAGIEDPPPWLPYLGGEPPASS